MTLYSEKRKYVRIRRNFKTRVDIIRTHTEVEGITEDVSQGGAFISSLSWPVFQTNDQTTVRLFLPPEMTGQTQTLTLQGTAVVKRVESERAGIAVEFPRELRTFEALW